MKTYDLLDLEEIDCGYSDAEFDELVALYRDAFGNEPAGTGNAPSRAFAIYKSFSTKEAVTLDIIKDFSTEDTKFVRDEKGKRWDLKKSVA